jgi:hypothetical protein
MSSRKQTPAVLIALTLITACGIPTSASPGDVGSHESNTVAKVDTTKAPTTTSTVEANKTEPAKNGTLKAEGQSDFVCPVTLPPQPGFLATEPEGLTYSEHFRATGWPREYPHEGMVWYGSEELWTALAIDGDHGERKSVWWSVNFPGGVVEEQPDVSVTWTRLDTEKPVVIDNGGEATNAFTAQDGWFMIAGIDPNQPGCWHVEATYKGATLSYVYEKTG